ncbi:unnamed protein product [Rotaria sordida]|uniref:NACHT domain-containing protein n=1 Tax=Rotaria sordida TaxID=392033 RepID=A0A815FF90_9BILA|nr:unnamed protein product [Rotaria sordida]CAF4056512.1 unnamed protein product [Rotaria sordida]
MNPTISIPIEQSYINLAIVKNKVQKEKEMKLREIEQHDGILGTYEEIYGTKTSIDVKDMFNSCTDRINQVLVFGRAGIGKSTFCRYIAYRWANGDIWSEYQLVIVIPLRCLTNNRYPPGSNYSLLDLLKKEHILYDTLSETDKRYFKELCDKGQVLWILDGYDEFVQNVPEHLQNLFDYVRETQHHILTSRPYAITLSYEVKMEITGFTDDNIVKYAEQFFNQIDDQLKDAKTECRKLLNFLQSKPNIWGIAHIPVNLELICSVWSDIDWSKTTKLTLTILYDEIIEWICRRYLTKTKHIKTDFMTRQDIYVSCQLELTFLETLAFHGMENNTIILRKELLESILNETRSSLKSYSQILNLGILKSLNDNPIGNHIETRKDHYFVHLSFQEHFTARYLVKTLNSSARQKAIDFIHKHKYNQRFTFVFAFASGLLRQSNYRESMDIFWSTIEGKPRDLVGLRHVQLIIACMDEMNEWSDLSRYMTLINSDVFFSELIPTETIILHSTSIVYHLFRTCQQLHRTNCCCQSRKINLEQYRYG